MPRRIAALVCGCLATLAAQACAEPARPARGSFVSQNYAITFRAPAGTTYCPIADDWIGSDHGTTLFLVPPADCGGAGYASSSRGFTPETTPRIEVYYGHWLAELAPKPCALVGQVTFLGQARPLCRAAQGAMAGAMAGLDVVGRYTAYGPAEASLTLVTTPARLKRDLVALRVLAASTRPCTLAWQDGPGRAQTAGSGAPCARKGDFY